MPSIVASIQLNSSDHLDSNLATMDRWVKQASEQGARLALLPENAAFMGKFQHQSQDLAETLGQGRVQTALAAIAERHAIWLVVGAFPTMEDGKIYQTLLVYDENGRLVEHYHKRHLFNVTLPDKNESYRESDAFAYGDAVKVLDSPIGKLGLAICYDLRFPEHFRALVDLGAEVLLLPAAFTYHTGKVHWETLLRARAIENQCYLIASAQVGEHPNGRQTWGHSMVINPWGDILAERCESEGFIIAPIDLPQLEQQRHAFPALTHRL